MTSLKVLAGAIVIDGLAVVVAFLPGALEDVLVEVAVVAGGLALLVKLYRLAKKFDHGYSTLMGMDKRASRMEETQKTHTGQLSRGEEHFRRIDERFGVLAAEERLIVKRALDEAAPERRAPLDRRDSRPTAND